MSNQQVDYIDHMGTDLSVVNSARVSMDKVSEWDITYDCLEFCGRDILKQEDAKLIHYLAKHKHWTPFAHTSVSLRVKAPVPIRTQCFKHKAGFVENEESRRYISSVPEVFYPSEWRMSAESVKQGSAGVHPKTTLITKEYKHLVDSCVAKYVSWVEDGVCPEQARFILPQGCMVNWIWTGNIAGYARFFNQRTDSHAQKESQELAKLVSEVIEPLFPVSWACLTKKVEHNVT